jgi:hypothetical protein
VPPKGTRTRHVFVSICAIRRHRAKAVQDLPQLGKRWIEVNRPFNFRRCAPAQSVGACVWGTAIRQNKSAPEGGGLWAAGVELDNGLFTEYEGMALFTPFTSLGSLRVLLRMWRRHNWGVATFVNA